MHNTHAHTYVYCYMHKIFLPIYFIFKRRKFSLIYHDQICCSMHKNEKKYKNNITFKILYIYIYIYRSICMTVWIGNLIVIFNRYEINHNFNIN
jgi:hypothetical protein